MKKILFIFLQIYVTTNAISQNYFDFIPSINKDTSYYLHDTIFFDFTFKNITGKDFFIIDQRNLKGAIVEYKLYQEGNWQMFKEDLSTPEINPYHVWGARVFIRNGVTYPADKPYFIPLYETAFLNAYFEKKFDSYEVRFTYDPQIVIAEENTTLRDLEKTKYLCSKITSQTFKIKINPYKRQDRKAMDWLKKQEVPMFIFINPNIYKFEYRKIRNKEANEEDFTIKKLKEFYKRFPKSQFVSRAKLIEAAYYIDFFGKSTAEYQQALNIYEYLLTENGDKNVRNFIIRYLRFLSEKDKRALNILKNYQKNEK